MEHQQLKFEENIYVCRICCFEIFPFLQIRYNDTNLLRAYEPKFQRECKTKLNQL